MSSFTTFPVGGWVVGLGKVEIKATSGPAVAGVLAELGYIIASRQGLGLCGKNTIFPIC
jgi:hypothetical protein